MTNVPDGWRLVPVEPTAEMIRALDDVHCASYLWPVRAYKAMIDAAPAAPQQAEPCDVCNALIVQRNATHYDADDLKAAQVRGKIIADKLHPPAPQQSDPVAWAVCDPSGEAIYAALFKTRCVEYMDNEYRYGHSAAKNWTVRPVFLYPPAEVQRMAVDLNRLRAAERAVTDSVYDRERLFAVTELRAALDALEGGE